MVTIQNEIASTRLTFGELASLAVASGMNELHSPGVLINGKNMIEPSTLRDGLHSLEMRGFAKRNLTGVTTIDIGLIQFCRPIFLPDWVIQAEVQTLKSIEHFAVFFNQYHLFTEVYQDITTVSAFKEQDELKHKFFKKLGVFGQKSEVSTGFDHSEIKFISKLLFTGFDLGKPKMTHEITILGNDYQLWLRRPNQPDKLINAEQVRQLDIL